MPGEDDYPHPARGPGLCLTRRAGQRVLIGDDVIVQVNWVDGNKVSLRFLAPADVLVLREELANGKPGKDDRRV